jgi:ATP-dependent RNA helicase DeaD
VTKPVEPVAEKTPKIEVKTPTVIAPTAAAVAKKPSVPFPERRPKTAAKPDAPLAKASRRTPEFQTRLYISAGSETGVTAEDVTKAIMGETGLPASVVGHVDVRERHLFVDVIAEHANSIISKLNRGTIKGRKIKTKLA